MKERALITGSHGFIGKNLSRTLEQSGIEVIPGDREGSIPEPVEFVFDLAAYGNLSGQNSLTETYRANVVRLAQLFENAGDYQAFVVTSSNSVKLRIGVWYQASKLAAEEMARLVAQTRPAVIVRPFSVTGVGEQGIHLIPKLIRSCLYGEEMPFVPEPAHDFVDVEDVARAYLLIAQNAKDHKGELFEIGTGQCYTNLEVKEIIERLTGKRANTRPVERMRSYDTKHWVADNRSLKDLGWNPTKSLEQSIVEMIDNIYERTDKANS